MVHTTNNTDTYEERCGHKTAKVKLESSVEESGGRVQRLVGDLAKGQKNIIG